MSYKFIVLFKRNSDYFIKINQTKVVLEIRSKNLLALTPTPILNILTTEKFLFLFTFYSSLSN